MTAQDRILRACNHPDGPRSEVDMGKGEIIMVCLDCWNRSVTARKAERKAQLADHWQQIAREQATEMQKAGATIGQRVSYFAPAMIGLGGMLITGTIKLNRNGVAVVRMDSKCNGRRETEWTKAWKHWRDRP